MRNKRSVRKSQLAALLYYSKFLILPLVAALVGHGMFWWYMQPFVHFTIQFKLVVSMYTACLVMYLLFPSSPVRKRGGLVG